MAGRNRDEQGRQGKNQLYVELSWIGLTVMQQFNDKIRKVAYAVLGIISLVGALYGYFSSPPMETGMVAVFLIIGIFLFGIAFERSWALTPLAIFQSAIFIITALVTVSEIGCIIINKIFGTSYSVVSMIKHL